MQIGFGLAVKKSAGQIPENLSKFVFAMGWTYYFIPVIGVIIDEGAGLIHGDFHRLGRYFTYHQYGIYFGIFTFAVAYFLCRLCLCRRVPVHDAAPSQWYLQDAYWRILVVDEDNFFFLQILKFRNESFIIAFTGRSDGVVRTVSAARWLCMTSSQRTPSSPSLSKRISTLPSMNSTAKIRPVLEMKPMKVFRHFFFTEGEFWKPWSMRSRWCHVRGFTCSTACAFSSKNGSNDVFGMALGSKLKEIDLTDVPAPEDKKKPRWDLALRSATCCCWGHRRRRNQSVWGLVSTKPQLQATPRCRPFDTQRKKVLLYKPFLLFLKKLVIVVCFVFLVNSDFEVSYLRRERMVSSFPLVLYCLSSFLHKI